MHNSNTYCRLYFGWLFHRLCVLLYYNDSFRGGLFKEYEVRRLNEDLMGGLGHLGESMRAAKGESGIAAVKHHNQYTIQNI